MPELRPGSSDTSLQVARAGLPGTGKRGETMHQMQAWKDNALAFLMDVNEEEMPVAVPLKQIIERPSTGEQNARAMKERQLIQDKKKAKELRDKQDNIEKERRILKTNKGSLAYDFEGKTIEVKPQQNPKQLILTTNIP